MANTQMKVLLRIRGDVDRFPGGDYLQLKRTCAALEQIGVDCRIAPGLDPVGESYDVVHLFNTTRIHETYLQFIDARRRGVPVVLSPIWHPVADMRRCYKRLYYLPFFPVGIYLGMKEAFYARRSGLPIYPAATLCFAALQRKLIAQSHCVLPNSQVELEILARESGVQPRASFIIPHGFTRPEEKTGTAGERKDLVCAGRLEPRKNQLTVIRAFKKLPRNGVRLLLYGSVNESHAAYFEEIRAELVEGWVEYHGEISQEKLFEAFRNARVVVLLSFFETFGLAALEGLACGATVCLSDTALNKGIYGERAVYADPFSMDSICDKLAAAQRLPLTTHDDFLQQFTWENTARETLKAYQFAVSSPT